MLISACIDNHIIHHFYCNVKSQFKMTRPAFCASPQMPPPSHVLLIIRLSKVPASPEETQILHSAFRRRISDFLESGEKIEASIREFLENDKVLEKIFPPNLDKKKRAGYHFMGEVLGLEHVSQGQGAARYLTLRKPFDEQGPNSFSLTILLYHG